MIINSISGLRGQENQISYSASKHAMMGLLNSLVKIGKQKNFDVICINPGGINTELWDKVNSKPDIEKFLNPYDLANLCVFLLKYPSKVFIGPMVILPEVDVI